MTISELIARLSILPQDWTVSIREDGYGKIANDPLDEDAVYLSFASPEDGYPLPVYMVMQ